MRTNALRRLTGARAAALAVVSALALAGCQSRRMLDWSDFTIRASGGPPGSVEPGTFESLSGTWIVRERADAPSPPKVLQQDRQGENADFNLLLLAGHLAEAGTLSVELRAVDGEHDQGGGLVWRAQGMTDYYLARWNPLEKNVRAYVVRNGERRMLASEGVDLADGWHRMAIEFDGARFAVSLDGRVALRVEHAAELAAGRPGVWTKADARTLFDDFTLAD